MHISEMQKKSAKSLLFLRYWRLNLLREIVHIATGILVMGSQRINKQSQGYKSD